jgi:hypothetical protein
MIYVTGKFVPLLNRQAMKTRRGAVKRFPPLEPGIVTAVVQVGYGSHNCLQTSNGRCTVKLFRFVSQAPAHTAACKS